MNGSHRAGCPRPARSSRRHRSSSAPGRGPRYRARRSAATAVDSLSTCRRRESLSAVGLVIPVMYLPSPASGWLGDRYGRLPVTAGGGLALLGLPSEPRRGKPLCRPPSPPSPGA